MSFKNMFYKDAVNKSASVIEGPSLTIQDAITSVKDLISTYSREELYKRGNLEYQSKMMSVFYDRFDEKQRAEFDEALAKFKASELEKSKRETALQQLASKLSSGEISLDNLSVQKELEES